MGWVALADLTTLLASVPQGRRFQDRSLAFGDVARGDLRVDRVVTDVWVFDPTFRQTLLVDHRRRGWVMPGGRVEPDETFRAAAVRELLEETGIRVEETVLMPAGAYLGPDPDSPGVDVGVSFAVTIEVSAPLDPEPGQPARWWPLEDDWPSIYPHDRSRLRSFCVDITRDARHAEER